MSGVLEAQARTEVLSQREQKLLSLVDHGKSVCTIAKLYREFEGEEGVEEAIRNARAKVNAVLVGRVDDGEGRTLAAAVADLVGPEHLQPSGSAERVNGAGRGPERAPRATPPTAPRPATPSNGSDPSGNVSTPAGDTPATATKGPSMGGKRSVVDPGERGRREDAAVNFIGRNEKARALEIADGAGIPRGSINIYMQRMLDAGKIDAVKADGVVYYVLPAGGSPTSNAAAKAPPAPPPAPPKASPNGHKPVVLEGSLRVDLLNRPALAAVIIDLRARLEAYEALAGQLERIAAIEANPLQAVVSG